MQPRRRPIARAQTTGQRRHRPDYWLVLLSITLLAIGLIVVYAISPGLSVQKHVSENYYVGKQLVAIAMGVVAFLVVANVPMSWWRRAEKPLIVIAALSAVAVRFFGERVNGAYRWIQIGGLSFQAAELIKFALLVWVAGFLSDRLRRQEASDTKLTLRPLLITLGIVAVVVGKVQSDLGSTAVIVAMMAMMAFVAGLPLKRIVLIGCLVMAAVVVLISSTSYRRARLETFLNPNRDCLNSGYQACQSLISVGSGGIIGLGLGRSVQAFGYQPEAANDSIFAIFAEKFGFIGTVTLIGLFAAFFSRLRKILERCPDDYTKLLLTGILAWLSTQTIINIGAMIGLLPLKGITLPFISYGGTSIVFMSAAIGIAFHASRYTTFGLAKRSAGEEGRRDDNRSLDRRRLRGAYHPNPSGR